MKRLLITTGDPDGIGTEITAKALYQLGPQRDFQFVLFRSPKTPKQHLQLLDEKFERITISKNDSWPAEPKRAQLLDIVSSEAPAKWFESAIHFCLKKKAAGIVTAPLSKVGISAAGMKDRGHTEILKRLTRNHDLFMAFWGRQFKVLLLTDHQSLMTVKSQLTAQRIRKGLAAARSLRELTRSKKPLAFVGINPHAGEEGLLGKEELAWKSFFKRDVVGPLVPDAAFLPHQWSKYSVYVCPYHDQGLIPFKLVHGFDEGVHLTLGLPFVRTSVDHGTAKELFGRNKAKYGSMREAIELAMSLNSRGKNAN